MESKHNAEKMFTNFPVQRKMIGALIFADVLFTSMNYAEIAAAHGVSLTTVKSWISKITKYSSRFICPSDFSLDNTIFLSRHNSIAVIRNNKQIYKCVLSVFCEKNCITLPTKYSYEL